MITTMQAFADGLAATPLSIAIQNVLWIVPAVQTVHLVAVAAVLSSMLMVGLRLIDVSGRFQTVEETLDRFLPWVWGGLTVLASTGLVLIVGEPVRTLMNPSFWLKMALLSVVLAGALWLRAARRRQRFAPDAGWHGGAAVRVAVACQLVLWCAVAVAGRWIAYTLPT